MARKTVSPQSGFTPQKDALSTSRQKNSPSKRPQTRRGSAKSVPPLPRTK